MFRVATACLVLAIGMAAGPACAQGAAATSSQSPLTEQARAGDLLLLQLWADDEATFLEEWSQPTPPRLTTTTATRRNDAIMMFIIFAGCTPNSAGNCSLIGKVDITDPDGLPYGTGTGSEFTVSESAAAPDPQLLVLSPASVGLIIEDGEKLGKYRVRLSVTDRVAGVTAVTEEELTVTEAAGTP